MSNEMDAAGAASLGGLSSGGEADLTGQPCRNCGTMVEDRFCPHCGQLASSFHRPFISLMFGSINDAFALDSRLARTMPLLMFRPGRLTQRYNDGKRARYVPPFRLFLLASLIFYFAVFALLDRQDWANQPINVTNDEGRELTPEEVAELRRSLQEAGIDLTDEQLSSGVITTQDGLDALSQGLSIAEEAASEDGSGAEIEYFEAQAKKIADNPRLLMMALQTWAPRLSLLLVPLTMLALTFMYFWHRRLYIYNHAIHALHLQAWMYVGGTLTILLSLVIGGIAPAIFFVILPFYLILSLRGAYGTGYFLSTIRMLILLTFWTVSMSIITVFAFIASVMSV